MGEIKYIREELHRQRLLRRKTRHWTRLEFLQKEKGEELSGNYSDTRWSASLVIKPLLFMATTIMLFGATILVVPGDAEGPYLLLAAVGTGILLIYERWTGKRFYKAGIDDGFIVTGTTLIVMADIVFFHEGIKTDHPIQYLVGAAIAWLAAVRYQHYIAYYGAFLLLQGALISFADYWRLPFTFYQFTSVLIAALGWHYFYRQRKVGPVLMYRWNETLEVFFMTMVAAALNPYYQDWMYGLYLDNGSDSRDLLYTDSGFVFQLLLNGVFVGWLLHLGVRQRSRIPFIVAGSSLFTGFLSVWYFYGQDWNVNLVLTFGGAVIFGVGLGLHYLFRKARWNIVSAKNAYQEETPGIFEALKRFREKINLKR